MTRGYNYIYEKLVEDESDIVGHIAYSLYKSDKVQFINQFKEKNSREPTEDELQPFHDVSCINGSLDRYKNTATLILIDFLDNTLSEYKHDIEQECKTNYRENIKEATQELHPISKARRYGEGIMQSVLGAFLFAIILAAFAFVIRFKGTDFPFLEKESQQNIEQVVQQADTIQ